MGGSSKETLAGWNKLVPSLGMVPSFFGNDFFLETRFAIPVRKIVVSDATFSS